MKETKKFLLSEKLNSVGRYNKQIKIKFKCYKCIIMLNVL